jgi:hypothetical protein
MNDKPTKWQIRREKRENKILFTIYALVIVFFLVLCLLCSRYPVFHKIPDDQPGSVWVSEDSTMTLMISDEDLGTNYLTAKVGNETLTFACRFGMSSSFHLCSIDVAEDNLISPNEIYENWSAKVIFSDRFTATVEKTTYFEEGQKIKFYRVDE